MGKIMGKLVSVIIPVYNREGTIKRAIQSVLEQTYCNVEVIVVDDCSDDHTRSVVSSIQDNRLYLLCQNERRGANAARNKGINNAKGDYIAFQDSDDEWLPNKLERQIELMEKQGFLGSYCAFYYYSDGQRFIFPRDFYNIDKYQSNLKTLIKYDSVVSTQTLIISRKILKMLDNQYFDEHMPRMQDFDFVVRILQQADLAYVNEPLVNVYKTRISITTDNNALYQAFARLLHKYKDFLDIKKFLNSLINSSTVITEKAENLIHGLGIIQKELTPLGMDCKDLMIERMSKYIFEQEELLEKQYKIFEKNLKDSQFAIYGAGAIGQEVYRCLKYKGLRPACFLVTKCEGIKYIDNICIISIDEYEDKENMVIISVSREHQLELVENLMQRNYKQFCIYQKFNRQ